MKFKVGDKAKVIKEGSHCQKIGTIVEIVEVDEKYNRYWADCPYNGNPYNGNPYNGKWYFIEDELGAITNKKPTKQELLDMPTGTKIYTDAEDEDYQVWIKTSEDHFYDKNGNSIDKFDIESNLKLDTDTDFGTKIIKIEKPTYETVYDYSTEVQEMTVAEIEKALGHHVKIIKEDN